MHLKSKIFKRKFQNLQFEYCETRVKEDGTVYITEESFCEAILAYAGFNGAKTKKILKRINRAYGDDSTVHAIFYPFFFLVNLLV